MLLPQSTGLEISSVLKSLWINTETLAVWDAPYGNATSYMGIQNFVKHIKCHAVTTTYVMTIILKIDHLKELNKEFVSVFATGSLNC